MVRIYSRPPFILGTHLSLDQKRLDHLMSLFSEAPQSSDGILEGRIKPVEAEIPGIGNLIVKHYRRGGIIRNIMKDRYLRGGKFRPQREYEMLERVRTIGVSSPEPIAWAIQGRMIYRGFLITRRIERSRSLSGIVRENTALCRSVIAKTAENINLLLKNRIHHVDLHPGNVLVDPEGQVQIIDFDKARRVEWHRDKLRAAYVRRWERAVQKYSLPAFMTDQLIEGLSRAQR